MIEVKAALRLIEDQAAERRLIQTERERLMEMELEIDEMRRLIQMEMAEVKRSIQRKAAEERLIHLLVPEKEKERERERERAQMHDIVHAKAKGRDKSINMAKLITRCEVSSLSC